MLASRDETGILCVDSSWTTERTGDIVQEFDLIIVGTGSANSIPNEAFDEWNIAIIEKGVFGGTCLNVGCIPSKMFIYAADVAESVRHASTYGVDASVDGVRWNDIVRRVFGRIDPIAAGGEDYRVSQCSNITVFRGEARFVAPKVLEVNGEQLTARHIVLGAGARVAVPPVPGLADVPYETSDTIMRRTEVPKRLLVLGGGYIASELGHVFEALGSEVTLVNRSDRLLRIEDDDISERFTDVMGRRFDLRLGTSDHALSRDADGITMTYRDSEGNRQSAMGDVLLVATGRTPNGDVLEVEAGGLEHDGPRVIVDSAGRTNVDGVWAFGDLSNTRQLKHLANYEVRTIQHNLLNPDDLRHTDDELTPHAVFSNPQVASVGLTERDARAKGLPISVAKKDYGATAYGWAMEDSDSFCKLVANRETRLLLGAHIIGPQAATLIQQLIQGMAFGQTVDEMARGMMYIHPALTEVVENALLDL